MPEITSLTFYFLNHVIKSDSHRFLLVGLVSWDSHINLSVEAVVLFII
jgi:hypothetical protein